MSNTTSTYFNKSGKPIKFILDSENDEKPIFCIVKEHDSDIARVAINVSRVTNSPKWKYSNVNFQSFAEAHSAMLNIIEHVQKLLEINVKGDL